jgi:predicted DNA-binding transcriptional regulator AlpA
MAFTRPFGRATTKQTTASDNLSSTHARPQHSLLRNTAPEWLSLQDAATYTGYSEQQFSDFVKRGIAPKSILFSRNARRFKRSDLDAWCAAGGPSALASKGEPDAVRR